MSVWNPAPDTKFMLFYKGSIPLPRVGGSVEIDRLVAGYNINQFIVCLGSLTHREPENGKLVEGGIPSQTRQIYAPVD